MDTAETALKGLTVVGVNGSTASKRALDWAADRVAQRGGRLELLCVVDLTFGAAVYGSHFDPVANASTLLEDARRTIVDRHPTLDVTTKWLDGRPAHELIRRSSDARLLVVGTDKRADAAGPRVGTLPLQVAAKAECPVAVIPDVGTRPRSGVVVGVDRSAESLSALAVAAQEAAWLGTDVLAIHAWNVPPVLERELGVGFQPDPRFVEAERRVVLDAIRDLNLTEAVRIVPEIVRENSAIALIFRARTAQLLVVGTRGRGRIASSILGSVSHDVLVNLPCPVMVVGDAHQLISPDVLPESQEDW